MKTNALLAFFLVALFASTRAEFVRDSEGHLVANGGIYYLLPQDFTGAAIVGASIENPDGSCSLAVVEKLLHNNGNATIIESKLHAAYITTDYPLQISFHPLPSNPCTQRPEWLATRDEDFGQNAVMVGDDSEFPYPVSGRLYFNTYDSARHHYSLVFCFDQYRCGPVAVKTDGYENRRLIVAAEQELVEPLVLKLVKISGDRVPLTSQWWSDRTFTITINISGLPSYLSPESQNNNNIINNKNNVFVCDQFPALLYHACRQLLHVQVVPT